MFKKIDIYGYKNGEWFYICSTNKSRTCREAFASFMKTNPRPDIRYKANFSNKA